MLTKILARLKDNPVLFVREILGAEPDEWQAEALNALAREPRTAIRSGHGVGKSCMQAWACLWFLFTHPQAKVVVTAPTMRQLFDVFMSEASKWLGKSKLLSDLFEYTKSKIAFKKSPAEWFLAARTAAKPENLAGFHADHLLFVLDEASGIDDSIFEVVEGALTGENNKLLMCSNPTRNSGFFKRAFYEDRELYYTMKISSADSQRVSDDYCQRLIKQYGEDSDVVRVRVLGEFPKAESDGLIALEYVEAAINREPVYLGDLVIGVDVARFGDDETVICPRIGNTVLQLTRYRKADLMTTCGRIIYILETFMKKYDKKTAKINVDDDGVGGGVTDRLREVLNEKNISATVTGCHNGGKTRDNHYANWGTESYFALRDRFISGEIILPRDDELTAQLTTRKYTLNSRDQLILEPKADYKKRFKRSPDRADALVLAFAPTAKVYAPPVMPLVQSYWRR